MAYFNVIAQKFMKRLSKTTNTSIMSVLSPKFEPWTCRIQNQTANHFGIPQYNICQCRTVCKPTLL